MLVPSRIATVTRSNETPETQAVLSSVYSHIYRPDVDGLRAVAALAVVAVHALWLPGGFLGVDIFFVISGFLISGIIFRSLQEEKFSLLDFYARRVRRIFPALIVLLVSVLIFGWIAVPSADRAYLGRQLVAGAGFAENLWVHTNHRQFSAPADYILGHLWTLGVEEQFYLVWPLLLMAMWLLPRRWRLWLMIVIIALSFGSYSRTDWWGQLLPWNRLWELALGAILAYLQHTQRSVHRAWMTPILRSVVGQSFGMIGAVCIVAALVGPGLLDTLPKGYALLPTFGAFMVIAAGPEQWVNRHVLAAQPVVFIGLISYPLYLWHMSLFIIARVLRGDASLQRLPLPLPFTWTVIVIVTSLILSYLTYRYIELPLRASRNTSSVAVLLCIAMAGCGIVAYFSF